MTRYPNLTAPITLRGHTLRNRIVFGAHTANMAEAGLPGPRYAAYLLERALGGAAMIVAEPVPVHRTGVLTRGNFLHSDDAIIPHFQALTGPIKAAGAVILQQLYHVGAHGDDVFAQCCRITRLAEHIGDDRLNVLRWPINHPRPRKRHMFPHPCFLRLIFGKAIDRNAQHALRA